MTDTPDPRRAIRAAALQARLPDVPPVVVEAMRSHILNRDFPERGLAAAMQDFYRELGERGLAPAQVTGDVFEAVATSRSRLRALLAGLRLFDTSVPLAPARPSVRRWDAWLNATYSQKQLQPRATTRVAVIESDWPEEWKKALPCLDRTVRPYGIRLRRLRGRSRESVVQAVGMLEASRRWAARRGEAIAPAPSRDLYEAFHRYLLLERSLSFRSARDYINRTKALFLRAGLLDDDTYEVIRELAGALASAASDEEPEKRATLRRFRKEFDLGDILREAKSASDKALKRSGCSTEAFRLRQKGLAYALLVNAGDRQGDLYAARLGIELSRSADGIWHHELRQGKTGNRKSIGALWPGTCRLLDGLILADRPALMIDERVAELNGANVLTLGEDTLGSGFINRRLKADFEIHGHLMRTLIVDLIRRHRPDADWAAKVLLGHTDRTRQETYRTDFVTTAAVQAIAGNCEVILGRKEPLA